MSNVKEWEKAISSDCLLTVKVSSLARDQGLPGSGPATAAAVSEHARGRNHPSTFGVPLELAKHEWARLKANDSLECRNCHSSAAMDLSKQTQRAAEIHTRYLLPGKATCIDCHKGIAHELPNMQGIEPGWKLPPELEGETLPSASVVDELRKAMNDAHRMLASEN